MASFPRLVVANSGRQFCTLCRCNDALLAGALGTVSAPAFSLHGRGNHPAGIWAQYSAVDRESFWDCAVWRPSVWTRSADLCAAVVGLLGHPAVHGRRAVSSPDCGLDA